MILNVSARTDIVNYYGEWLMNRFREGFVYTRNPLFPNRVTRYELTPEKLDAVLFSSKNFAPFFPHVPFFTKNYRTYFYYTITAYGKDIEPHVPDISSSVDTLLALSELTEPKRLAWRYDPVLLTEQYPIERHLDTFRDIAARVRGRIDRCIFSFVEMHIKLYQNMPEIVPLTLEQKRTLAEGLGKIARSYGIRLQTCGELNDYSAFGIARSACATLPMLGSANGCTFRNVVHRGNRRNCKCIESRDVGTYNTCPNKCRYCYANTSAEEVDVNREKHDPASPIFIGHLKNDDRLMQGLQLSHLKSDEKQISLFDL